MFLESSPNLSGPGHQAAQLQPVSSALRLQRSAERIDFHWFVAVWIPKSSQWFMGEMKVCEKLVRWIRCKRFLKSVQVTLKKGHLLDIFQLFLLNNCAFGDVHIPYFCVGHKLPRRFFFSPSFSTQVTSLHGEVATCISCTGFTYG